MSKRNSKLLIAITTGLFAATAASGAFAQGASDSSAAGANAASGSMSHSSKHKSKHHTSGSKGKKTPAQTTGDNPATENGQGK
jgi:hypothetical protein